MRPKSDRTRSASHEQVAAENEGEEQFVLFEQRAAHVAVEVVGEVVTQVAQALLQVLRLVAAVDRVRKFSSTTMIMG